MNEKEIMKIEGVLSLLVERGSEQGEPPSSSFPLISRPSRQPDTK